MLSCLAFLEFYIVEIQAVVDFSKYSEMQTKHVYKSLYTRTHTNLSKEK